MTLNPNADPLALTLASEAARQKASKGSAGASGSDASASKAPRVKARTTEQLAGDYYTSSGSAISAAARGGGKTGDFLSEHGAIEHRVTAVKAHKYQLSVEPAKGKGCAQLTATFRAVRKDIAETVQLLTRDELLDFFRALSSRGSSSRGGSNSHLLTTHAMASRSYAHQSKPNRQALNVAAKYLRRRLRPPLLLSCIAGQPCCGRWRTLSTAT